MRKFKQIILILLTIVIAFSAVGCRESLVLSQIIHDQQAQEKDKQNDTKVAQNDKNSQNEDEELNKQKNTDTKKKTDTKQEKSVKGKGNNGTANDTTHNNNANNNKDNDSDGKRSDSTGDNDGKKQDDSTGGQSDDPNNRQVYDNNGNVVDLPKNVNSVVAAGNIAVITQMLGGKGILKGTSANIKSGMAATVFNDEQIGNAKEYWSGNGDSPMSASSFSQLLKLKPDVCLCESGENSFSADQISQLKKNKIAYLTVPRLNTYTNIKACVEAIGQAIGDRTSKGGQNAKSLSSKYVDYADGLIDSVEGQTGYFSSGNTDYNYDSIASGGSKSKKNTASNGKYALYVSGWDSGRFTVSFNGSKVWDETGLAVAPHGYSDSPLSYFMSSAGVCNSGARLSQNVASQYLVIPFNLNNINSSVTSQYSVYPNKNENFAAIKSGTSDYGLGESVSAGKKFPAVIVANNSVKSALTQSKNSGMWKSNGKVTVNGNTNYGFDAGGSLITSYIRGNYDIYVNPAGVSTWTEGSAESVLEVPWVAYKFQGYSESSVRTSIKDFYKNFYRYDISDSMVNEILSGK